MAIINAAIGAIEAHGPHALTGQIAEMAGVPRTHVYRHFEGKQALDFAVARHAALQIGQQIRTGLATQGSALDVISASINEHLGWIEAHPNLYRFLAQHAYAVNATGSPTVDDAKAAFATELTAPLLRALHDLLRRRHRTGRTGHRRSGRDGRRNRRMVAGAPRACRGRN